MTGKPYLRDRRCGDPCDFGTCEENKELFRVNPKGEPGIFMCQTHALATTWRNVMTETDVGRNGDKPIVQLKAEQLARPPRNIDRGQWHRERALTFARDLVVRVQVTSTPAYETVLDLARWIVGADEVADADALAEDVRLAFWDAMEHGTGEIDFNDEQITAVVSAFRARTSGEPVDG